MKSLTQTDGSPFIRNSIHSIRTIDKGILLDCIESCMIKKAVLLHQLVHSKLLDN